MLSKVVFLIDLFFEFMTFFWCERYVFLEKGMEYRKQGWYYLISIMLILGCYILIGDSVVMLILMLMVGLNISLAREKHRFRGFFLSIPIVGMVYGLAGPILIMPANLLSFSESARIVYRLIIYGMVCFCFLLFKKGKKYTYRQSEMVDRKLQTWELWLLCFVGVLMMFYSNIFLQSSMSANIENIYNDDIASQFLLNICLVGIVSFILIVTIIVLIMQGNKRSFYHERVSNMQSGMITFMAEVVENRDDNTGGHIRRTAKYVESIAKELKRQGIYSDILTDRYMEDMVVAAPLHDIGKIHIPDAVLNKPGKLTEEEFEIMKTHTTAGEELLTHAKEELGESGYLNTAVEMAAYHHEWWNGEGYPYGISGEEIPLCARIMAVADVFDALTSKRCYKNAMPLEKAYAIIREESGTHFDPAVVVAFFAVMEDIGRMREIE